MSSCITYPAIVPKISSFNGLLSLINTFPDILAPRCLEILSLRTFKRDVLPEPEAPMINTVCPGSAYPETPFKIYVYENFVPSSLACFLDNFFSISMDTF